MRFWLIISSSLFRIFSHFKLALKKSLIPL